MPWNLWHAGYAIKKGTSVNLDVVSIHHDPAVFADPNRFDPNRFDVGSFLAASSGHAGDRPGARWLTVCVDAQETLKPYSFLGFGSGPRMCPGMSLAKLEICVFVHHLVCRYT
jgi:cytochrome P450